MVFRNMLTGLGEKHMMDLLQKFRALRKKRRLKQLDEYSSLSENSYYGSSFTVDIRHPLKGKIYLEIGTNCMIDGNFVFESEMGMIKVGDRCHIGNGSLISRSRIVIGNDVTMAWGFTIYDHDSHSVNWDERMNDTVQEYEDVKKYNDPIFSKDWSKVNTKPIIINDKVWIGMNVIILKGVTVGEGAVIGAGSVVTRDIAPWSVVAGNPARVVKILGAEA